ncbi:MAG: tetratricopeptide repeat protein [Planctomycetes bacterium]|nr:tetratricopeptide repeat protein [Planctomycetota bacterium]
MQRIAEAPPHRPSSLVKGIGGDLEAILLKALEKEPDRRYSSASALGDDLRRTLSGEAIMARRPSRVYAVRRKLRKHRWRIAMAAAVVAVSSLAVWGALSWQERAAERQHERDSVEARSKARYEAIRLQRALESGRVESALGPARTLASNHQDLPEARFVWIQAQYRMGRSGDDDDLIHAAIAQLKERVERGPSPWAYRDLLAEVVDETGGRLPAELLAREIPASPDTADAWFLRSLATLDLLVANAHLHEALDRDPRHLAARERLAYVCLLTGDYDGALAAAEALSASAEDARWPLLPAEVLMRGEQYGEAVVRLTEVIALDSSPLAHRYRAVAHLCLGDYEAAIDDYSRAAELRPRGDMWSRYGRATPLWITGYLERAAEDYRAVREARSAVTYADVRLFFVLHDLADHLEGRGLPDEAASRRAEAEAVLTTGREGVAAGSWLSKIIACLAGALAPEDLVAGTAASNPEQACEALYYAGEAQRLGGRPEEARALFRQCVETGLALDPNSGAVDPMNEYHLARWRFQAGERGSR